MENITTIIDSEGKEHVQIEVAEGHFISMPKSEYDRRQAEQSTPSLTDETSTK
jgi:hypothetical protein